MAITFDWDSSRRRGIVSGEFFDEIREYFSVKNDGAKFARYRGRFSPSRKYAITATGRFDVGLYSEISKFIKKYDVTVRRTLKFKENFKSTIGRASKISPLSLKLRKYQKDAVEKCLEYGRGVVVLATAGGKTLAMATLLESVYTHINDFKCVVIVPNRSLVTQTYNAFKEYDTSFTTSKWTGDDDLDLGTNVIICNLGILQSAKSNVDWLSYVDMCVFDECHHAKQGNKLNKLLRQINTHCRFGFTGTMPENLIDQWNVIGKFGPVIYEKSSYDLRKDKFIADAKVQVLRLEYKNKPQYIEYAGEILQPAEMYRRELDFLIHSNFRNKILGTLCNRFDKNALILVDYIEHGTILHDFFSKGCIGKECYFIRGEVAVEDRENVKQLMEENDNIIIVAISKIFSTGINIKNLHYIVFASGGKAKIKIIQSIGRGLRLHKDKHHLTIFDIGDNLRYGSKHLAKRITYYQKENIEYGSQTINETA